MARKSAKDIAQIAVIYARYSSHAQKDASIEQQIAECTAFARQQGLSIIDTYEDRAVSGRSDKRPNFQRMMKDAEKGKFSYVIAWKSNRIGRNMLQAMINEERLNELGVRCLYTEEDFDDTAAGRFALRSMMNVNQFYSENMAEDIRRGIHDNAMQCKVTNGGLPFGFKVGDDLRYAIDEPRAAIVREIYSRVACGEQLIRIAEDLNARGIKTSRGRQWGRSSFHTILSNERYRGIYIYSDVRIEDGCPRIISDELFFKVQEVLHTKKNAKGAMRRSSGDYLLTGKLYCGKCKSPMSGIAGTSKSGKMHYYYTCQKKRFEKSCDKQNVVRDEIEDAVAKAIYDYALTDEIIEMIADSTVKYFEEKQKDSNLAMLQDELSGIQTAIGNVMKAIEMGIITPSTKDRLMELEAQRTEVSAKIATAKANIITVSRDDIISGLTMLKDGDITDKKYQAKLFNAFLVAVYVFDDELLIQFSFSGKNNTIRTSIDIENCMDTDLKSRACVRLDSPLSHQIPHRRTQPAIYSFGDIFVLCMPLKTTDDV